MCSVFCEPLFLKLINGSKIHHRQTWWAGDLKLFVANISLFPEKWQAGEMEILRERWKADIPGGIYLQAYLS